VTADWDRLRAPYFEASCARVLQPYLARLGFGKHPYQGPVRVIYAREDVFVEVGYWVEDSPRYVLQGGVGILRPGKALNGAPRLDGVGLWRFNPDHDWGPIFSDEQQLDGALAALRDDLLEPIVRPIWEDRQRLEAVIARFRPR
jgi:hypothetical protein